MFANINTYAIKLTHIYVRRDGWVFRLLSGLGIKRWDVRTVLVPDATRIHHVSSFSTESRTYLDFNLLLNINFYSGEITSRKHDDASPIDIVAFRLQLGGALSLDPMQVNAAYGSICRTFP